MDYSQLLNIVNKEETEIENLGIKINQQEKNLNQLDYEILQNLKSLAENFDAQKAEKLRYLMSDEEEQFQTYLDTRIKRDATLNSLRSNYVQAIKLYYKSQSQLVKKSHSDMKPVDLTSSQLLTGTSYTKGEMDDLSAFKNTSCWIPDLDIRLLVKTSGVVAGATNKDQSHLGSGDSTEVYKGVCRGTEVAVKVLLRQFDEKALGEFKKECEVLKGILNHPNLLLFMGACVEDGKHKIVLEWAQNGSLADLMKDEKIKFSFSRKVSMIKEICTGMNWLHNSDPVVLHLNLKPSNILLSRNYAVKITDYGLGQNKIDLKNSSASYIAPELLRGDPPTPKADVFSFAILIWFILNQKAEPYGESLYERFKEISRFLEHLQKNQRPHLSKETYYSTLNNLIEKCWSTDPASRPTFQSILDDNPWEKIITEVSSHGDNSGAAIWKGFNKNVVPWKDFAMALAHYLEIPYLNDPELLNRLEWKCIHALLEVQNDQVSHPNFLRFLSFFGPVRTGAKEGAIWLDEIRSLLQKKWFHGPIDARTAQNRIVSQCQNPPQKFGKACSNGSGIILRFSNEQSNFTLTFKAPKEAKVINTRIEKSQWVDIPSLIALVDNKSKKEKLDPIFYERKYQYLFEKTKPKKEFASAGNYAAGTFDPKEEGKKKK